MQADGFSLDDKRTPQPEKNDIPDILRERSELYKEATQNPKEAKKGFWDFLKR